MNAARQSILSIDIGSSFVKAACIGTDGSIVVSCKVALPSIVNGDRVEIGVQPLWKAFVDSVGLLRQNGYDLSGCIGMGITTQMAGLILLDHEGQPLCDFILGVDQRGAGYVQELSLRLQGTDIYSKTGCPLSGIYPSTKLLSLQAEEPHILKKAHYIGGIKEYLLWRLTGNWMTDPASASTTQLYDQQQHVWWPDMLSAVGVASEQLPQVCDPDCSAGALLQEAIRELGLPAVIPTVVGTGDGPAANLSSGSVTGQQLCISLGTTAVTRFWAKGTDSYTGEDHYFRQHFGWDMYLQGIRLEGAGQRISELLPIQSLPDSKTGDSTQPSDHALQLQEVLDSILFTLYALMEPLVVQGRFEEIRPIGGGVLSESWMQDIADLFELPVLLTAGGDSTLGAAMIVIKHIEAEVDWKDISDRLVRVVQRIKPCSQASEVIHQRYESYNQMMKGGRRDPFRP